jgi:hypothetical protein
MCILFKGFLFYKGTIYVYLIEFWGCFITVIYKLLYKKKINVVWYRSITVFIIKKVNYYKKTNSS